VQNVPLHFPACRNLKPALSASQALLNVWISDFSGDTAQTGKTMCGQIVAALVGAEIAKPTKNTRAVIRFMRASPFGRGRRLVDPLLGASLAGKIALRTVARKPQWRAQAQPDLA
jgi:hypothetical protein